MYEWEQEQSNYKSFYDIYKAYCNNEYQYDGLKPTIKRVRPNHVFDEDKSVKWNREEVERHNKEFDEDWKLYWKAYEEHANKLEQDIKKTIKDDYDFCDEVIDKIYSYVYVEKHSYTGDMIQGFEEVCDLVKQCAREITLDKK